MPRWVFRAEGKDWVAPWEVMLRGRGSRPAQTKCSPRRLRGRDVVPRAPHRQLPEHRLNCYGAAIVVSSVDPGAFRRRRTAPNSCACRGRGSQRPSRRRSSRRRERQALKHWSRRISASGAIAEPLRPRGQRGLGGPLLLPRSGDSFRATSISRVRIRGRTRRSGGPPRQPERR